LISTASCSNRCCTPFAASMESVLVKMGSGKPTNPTHGTSTACVIEPKTEPQMQTAELISNVFAFCMNTHVQKCCSTPKLTLCRQGAVAGGLLTRPVLARLSRNWNPSSSSWTACCHTLEWLSTLSTFLTQVPACTQQTEWAMPILLCSLQDLLCRL